MWRRRGSATALNASEVVAALTIGSIYSYMGICQAEFLPRAKLGAAAKAFASRVNSVGEKKVVLGVGDQFGYGANRGGAVFCIGDCFGARFRVPCGVVAGCGGPMERRDYFSA